MNAVPALRRALKTNHLFLLFVCCLFVVVVVVVVEKESRQLMQLICNITQRSVYFIVTYLPASANEIGIEAFADTKGSFFIYKKTANNKFIRKLMKRNVSLTEISFNHQCLNFSILRNMF